MIIFLLSIEARSSLFLASDLSTRIFQLSSKPFRVSNEIAGLYIALVIKDTNSHNDSNISIKSGGKIWIGVITNSFISHVVYLIKKG